MRQRLICSPAFDPNVLIVNRTRFWAERGLIHCDGPDGYQVLSVYSFLRHVQGICDMLGGSSPRSDHVRDAALRAQYQDIVDKSLLIARRAQEQGSPDDASACRDLVRRRPTTVCMGAGATF